MPAGIKANSDGSAAIQVGGTDVITLTSGGAATFVTSPTTVQAGTAAAPSITFSGDTNTGIYSPGADQVAIATGGTAAIYTNSSQNVGVNTTSPLTRMHVQVSALSGYTGVANSGLLIERGNGPAALNIASPNTESGFIWFADQDSASVGNIAYNHPSNFMSFQTNGAERARIDSSGNLGIGTSSPADSFNFGRAIDIGSTTGSFYYCRDTDATNGVGGIGYSGTDVYVANKAVGNIRFFCNTDATERARITSAGEFWVAGTTDQGAYNIQCNGTGVWGAGAYVNGSDARIKENIAPITSSLDVVTKLNPVTYRYKEDWSKDQSIQTGFIAQELLVAMEGQNYVDGVVQQGGSEGYYSVAYQNIIPLLTKAIQELKAELDATKAEVAALKGI